LVFANTPTLVTPVLGAATGTTLALSPSGASGLTLTGATETTSQPLITATQTWNASGVTFTGLKVNITNTASAAASLLTDVQIGGVSTWNIAKTGCMNTRMDGSAQVFWAISNMASFPKIQTTSVSNFILNNATNDYFGVCIGINKTVITLSDWQFGWSSSTSSLAGPDLALARDAANTLALRNSTAAQAFRPYGYYSSASSRAYGAVQTALAAVTLSGATTATGNVIPAGAFIIGVATTTTTTITGASGYQIGDGADADRWGDITGTAVGTDSDNTDSTANPTGYNAAASAVTLTAKTSNFTGGVVQVVVFYLTTGAD
jgi:hypothetical protein